MAKIVRFGAAARVGLARGIDIAADLVATTLGPAGRAVLVGQAHAGPLMLRNGYAVVQQLDLADTEQQAGVLLMRELAWRTSDQVGDGTSTSIVMARAFLRAAERAVLAGVSRVELQNVIDLHCQKVTAALIAASCPATEEMLILVATQAAGGDAVIGALVADAHARAGPDGIVVLEEGRGSDDSLQLDAGLHFDQGSVSSHFLDDVQQRSVEIADPLILLHLGPVSDIGPIVPALEMIAKAGRGLLLIAESIGGDALSTLVVNKQRAGFKVAAVQAPGVGHWRRLMLEDIAVATGGMVIAGDAGASLENLRPQMAGRAQLVRISQTATTIIGGHADPVARQLRIREIRDSIVHEKHLSFDREQHRKRLARLEAGIVTVRVGGITATEIVQRLDRARAASAALRAAHTEGVQPGASAALVHAGRCVEGTLPQNLAGRMVGRMFAAALQAPLRVIADNAGLDGCAVARRLANGSAELCFDVQTRHFVPSGALLDPTKVLRAALLNSVSVASRLIDVGATVGSTQDSWD